MHSKQIDVKHLWNEAADNWTKLNSQGANIYRDFVNNPMFYEVLPSVKGLKCLDIGCGEGTGSRALSDMGAKVVGVDISDKMIEHAERHELIEPRGVEYLCCDAAEMNFSNGKFDGAVSICAMMDIDKWEIALSKVKDALKKGAFFQFSVTHPCFWNHHNDWIIGDDERVEGIVIKNYFDHRNGKVGEWTFDQTSPSMPKFKTAIFNRTLSDWVNSLHKAGFAIESMYEPRPSKEVIKRFPSMAGSGIVPFFLIFKCRSS